MGVLATLVAGARADSRVEDFNVPAVYAPMLELNHVVLAVRDLDAASRTWRALGFTLKPGRTHANGIRNCHVKFQDGTEIELLTVGNPRDALAREYASDLRAGDGPAFLCLYTRSDDLADSLGPIGLENPEGPFPGFPAGHPLHFIFFGDLNQSPTDRPAHFAHANGACSLIAAWITPSDPAPVRRMFAKLETPPRPDSDAPRPCRVTERVWLGNGEILLLTEQPDARPDRPVYGATVAVENLDLVRKALDRAGIRSAIETARGKQLSLVLPPSATHGLWLEFRQVPRPR